MIIGRPHLLHLQFYGQQGRLKNSHTVGHEVPSVVVLSMPVAPLKCSEMLAVKPTLQSKGK